MAADEPTYVVGLHAHLQCLGAGDHATLSEEETIETGHATHGRVQRSAARSPAGNLWMTAIVEESGHLMARILHSLADEAVSRRR